ncbi:MAG: glycoside hydrolase family 88 protein [Eubacteriales bacterium]|nr:glycoside hydrolase family 88 protein [Eubacteriales bacterium]
MISKEKIALLAMQRYSWEQGTAMQAFLEAGDMDIVIPMAYEAVYRCASDGRVAQMGNDVAATDPCSTGEAILAAYQKTGDKTLEEGLERLTDWALSKAPRSEQGIVYHLIEEPEFWSDSFYMLPPFLAAIGEYEESLKQIYGYLDALMDEKTHLISHRWNEKDKKFIRKAFWGTGNGWALAGIARVIDALPDTYGDKKDKLVGIAGTILDSVLGYLREDGLFHDVLDDPSSFIETNCSQMAAYTIYRGVASGWLSDQYLDKANKMRNAAAGKTDIYGRVHDVCGAPYFESSGDSPEANAFAVLMNAAAEKCGL